MSAQEKVQKAAVLERRQTVGRRLTDRQTAVLELVASGLGNKEIAHQLGISEQAVKEHVSNLLRLLAAPNRAALGDAAATLRMVGTTNVAPEWLGLLFLHAPLLIALLEGPEHRFIAVNEAYRRASGDRDLVGLTFREAFPDLDEAGIAKLMDEAFQSGEARAAPDVPARWYRRAPGALEPGYLATLVQPMRREDGSVGGIVLFGIDATEEVQARNGVRELSHERETILEQLPSGVITIDTDGVVLSMNAIGREILGVGNDVVGASAWEMLAFRGVDGSPLPVQGRPLRRALLGERVDASDYTGQLTATGKLIHIRTSAAPLFDEQGRVRGAVAVFTPLSRP